MKIGNFIKVKDGVKEPDANVDMNGWTGRIIELGDFPNIEWDNETLQNLPHEFTHQCEVEGLGMTEYNLAPDDFEIVDKGQDYSKDARAKIIREIHSRHEGAINENDDEEVMYGEILGTNRINVTLENLSHYEEYLDENLSDDVRLTGMEVFSWEERFFFGEHSKTEYQKLRKTRPSYKDEFKLVEIIEPSKASIDHDLLVKVRRVSDRKMFDLPLSWLAAIDAQSDDYALLEAYSSWAVNY
ncbi:MAG: hypothetical protein ACI85O_001009 [Saprospiraceae bacterium]|jgi:hypothetical protein